MPRPIKTRKVQSLPPKREFVPTDGATSFITLTVEEYETIRLIDAQGYSQEACGDSMEIGRASVQMIYDSARKKIALALSGGTGLRILGGNYELNNVQKGILPMKIAVTYENGQIFQHFGHTEQFKIYEVEDGTITKSYIVDTNGSGHGALAGFLFGGGVDVLICGGIGGGAQMALAQAGIRLFGGVSGDADAAVDAFIKGALAYNPDVRCNHHDHEHGEGHTCGDHGCGDHHEEGHHCGGHCGQ